MFEKLKNLSAEVEIMKKKIRETGQEYIKDAFKEFFESFPEIQGITWTQYTPYFNDGDECIFGVNEFEFKPDMNHPNIVDDVKRLIEYAMSEFIDDDNDIMTYTHGSGVCLLSALNDINSKRNHLGYSYVPWAIEKTGIPQRELTTRENEICEACNELQKICYKMSDAMKETFGDHVMVLITKDNIKITDIDHD